MLTMVRNASRVKFEKVDVPASKLKLEITKILKNEGYIKTFKKISTDGRNYIRIFLKYDSKERPVIRGIRRVSTPGRRMYSGYTEMPRVYNGYGTLIVSTSKGVTTGRKAKELQVGGEIVCSVW
jgi:small subunit ribosomal protein S8